MKRILEDTKQNYEKSLTDKESRIMSLNQEILELNLYKDEVSRFENKLKESENRFKNLQEENEHLNKDLEDLDQLTAEQDADIKALNSTINEMQKMIDDAAVVMKEKEKYQSQQENEIINLAERNKELEVHIAMFGERENLLKEDFNKRIEEVEKVFLLFHKVCNKGYRKFLMKGATMKNL